MNPLRVPRPLTRRAFLRLIGLTTAGEILTGCGSSQTVAHHLPGPSSTLTHSTALTPTSMPLPTYTATPTPSPSATLTPAPTATLTPTATSTPTPTCTPTPAPTPTRGPLQAIVLIHGPSRFLVVDHVLKRLGVLSTAVRVDLGEAVPDLRAYDAVIFAGGEYRASEFEEPFFQAERERIMDAVEADVPILGICLGHQLLAYWLGGEVKRRRRWEVGWLPIAVNEVGLADPLLAGLGETFYAFLWHGDQVTRLPEAAVLLASSERCRVQVYRLRGRPVWGLQFNPQYDPVMVETLVRNSPWLPRYGYDVDKIVATGYREYNDLAGRIFGNFFQVVLEGEGSRATPIAPGDAGAAANRLESR